MAAADLAGVLTSDRGPRHPPGNRLAASRIRRNGMSLSSIRHRLFAACQCCSEPFAARAAFAPSRRELLAGAAATALAGGGTLYAPRVMAQAKPHRIDVHHHIAPPSWLAAMDVIGRTNPPLANWSVQK